MRIAATFTIVVLGLVLLRWVAAVTAAPTPAVARAPSGSGELPSIRAPSAAGATGEPTEEIDRLAAYEEALRLAREALLDDDLETARSFYFLAGEALPGDPEAEARVRQVDTVADIDERTSEWRGALEDVENLMAVAPESATISRAYTEALVGAGLEALMQDNVARAQQFCGEATRRAPARNDARLCLARASATATAVLRDSPAELR